MKNSELTSIPRRLLVLGLALLPVAGYASSEKFQITMWRGPKCGCCKEDEVIVLAHPLPRAGTWRRLPT